ncbi:hypothetical protein [Halobacillus campisalis]
MSFPEVFLWLVDELPGFVVLYREMASWKWIAFRGEDGKPP